MTGTEAYTEIIECIWQQRYNMIEQCNIEPNQVILGKALVDILRWESGAVYCGLDKNDNSMVSYVIGLPITVDYNNMYTIQVCYVPKTMNMGYLFNK